MVAAQLSLLLSILAGLLLGGHAEAAVPAPLHAACWLQGRLPGMPAPAYSKSFGGSWSQVDGSYVGHKVLFGKQIWVPGLRCCWHLQTVLWQQYTKWGSGSLRRRAGRGACGKKSSVAPGVESWCKPQGFAAPPPTSIIQQRVTASKHRTHQSETNVLDRGPPRRALVEGRTSQSCCYWR